MGSRRARARRWATAAGAATLALAPAGCYEGFDPFDPEVLEAVMRSRGDAEGFERSGVYGGMIEVIDCTCSEVDESFDVSLCSALDRAETLGLPLVVAIELVQADGAVRLQAQGLDEGYLERAPLLPTYYGALWAEGRLQAATVLAADALLVQGQVLGRVDGTLVPTDDGWRLEAEYQQRYAVDLYVEPSSFDVVDFEGGQSLAVDCRERIALDLRWLGPPGTELDL
jgi:hypothetical protein